MQLNKLAAIKLLLKKASRIAADLNSGNGYMERRAEIDLLSVLFQIQSMVISSRAERCIGQLLAENQQLVEKRSFYEKAPDVMP